MWQEMIKMKIDRNIVHFKSTPEMCRKEMGGIKSNTVRLLTEEEYNDLLEHPPTKIMITNTESDLRFGRMLSDITYFRSKPIGNVIIGIFSWR